MDSVQYSQCHELGKQEAYASLAAWQELGWPSQEACRQQLVALASGELAHARERAEVTSGASFESWQQHIAYFEGHLAALC